MAAAMQTQPNMSNDASVSNWFLQAVQAYDDEGNPNFLDANGDLLDGIYLNMPNGVYHSLDAYSSTAIKKFAESPALFYREYLSGISRLRTNAMQRTFDAGTYGHELCLEPDGFNNRYFRDLVPADLPDALTKAEDIEAELVKAGLPAREGKTEKLARLKRLIPNIDLSEIKTLAHIDEKLADGGFNKSESKADKAYRLIQEKPDALVFDLLFEENRKKQGERTTELDENGQEVELFGGKKPIDGIVWDDAHRVQKTVRSHQEADLHLSYGMPEVAIIARCPITGFRLKVKFDWLRFDDHASDVKTTQSSKPEDFRRQLRNLHYDIQAAFYCYVASLAGIQIRSFTFVAVEYINADICQPYELSRAGRVQAESKLEDALLQLKECLQTNKWYGWSADDCTMVI